MSFNSYMKEEIEKSVFIEIKENLVLNINGNPVIKKGEYPILAEDVLEIAKKGMDNVTASMLIDGMIYIIACDPDFTYLNQYIETLKSIDGLDNYIIMNIKKFKDNNLKKCVILSTGLSRVHPKREYIYNRILLLIELYNKTKLGFIEEEIVASLKNMTEEFNGFAPPNLYLGKYYLDKDIDVAKLYLRKCIEDGELMSEAAEILSEIEGTEKFDDAVEYIKNGHGLEALKILLPICNNDYENLDAKYYAAIAYRQIGNNTKALIYLRELLDFAERPEVYSEIGINLAEIEDYEAAIVYLKKALKIMPSDSGVICNIGVCQLNLSQFEEAKSTFELALRINPKDEIASRWLITLNEGEGNGN